VLTVTRWSAAVTFDQTNWWEPVAVPVVADPWFDLQPGRENLKSFPKQPHLLAELRGPLAVEGGTTGADRSLQPAILLPGEANAPLFGIGQQPPESGPVDVLNVFDDSSQQDQTGELTATGLTGFGMSTGLTFPSATAFGEPATFPGGISFGTIATDPATGRILTDATRTTIEVLNVLLGQGNDRLTIASTLVPGPDPQTGVPSDHGGITAVHGGGNALLQVTGTFDLGVGNALTRTDGGSWADAGFAPGQQIVISGGFGGTFTVDADAGATLTLAGAPLAPASALVGTVAVLDPKTQATRIGGDTIVVTGGAGPDSPLVVYGDTSQDGAWYAGDPARLSVGDFGPKPFPDQIGNAPRFVFPLANRFDHAGHDVIDASALLAGASSGSLPSVGLTAYGGAGDDILLGSQTGDFLAGGSGDDVVAGGRGIDQIYGDSGVNVDLIKRVLTIPTANASAAPDADGLVAGRDTLHGDGPGSAAGTAAEFEDVVFGDHGAVVQDVDEPGNTAGPKPQKIQTTLRIVTIGTREPQNGADDTITGDLGIDRILGGNGHDTIQGNEADDLILGDHGRIHYPTPDSGGVHPDLITTTDSNAGGPDTIEGNEGFDVILGGTAGDVISGNDGNDLVFGDHGQVAGNIDTTLLPLSLPLALHPFAWTSIDTGAAQGGGPDLIRGNAGDDIVLGGQASDRITGGDGDDDVIGGHNVAGGADAGDFIDTGAGNDWVAGDNADLLRTGTSLSPRFRVLSDGAIFDALGNAQVTPNPQLDPNALNEERAVMLFDHSATAAAGTFGADVIAGGAQDDVIFGELGDDWIQGDGSAIDDAGAITIEVVGRRQSVEDWAGIGTDGRDYVEGNGGDDTIFGGLGQDDLIGGSSSLYSLATPDRRPGGKDTIFGGAGVRLVRDDFGDTSPQGHAHDADVIMGDNANVFRLVGTNGAPSAPYGFLHFVYDNYSTVEAIIPRAYTFLDYTQGGAASDIGNDDLIHGENGDDTIHGQVGNDVLFGEGQDDDIYGGTGFDRIYGGTGQDGVLGDDGKIYTSRNGQVEPLNRLTAPNLEHREDVPGPFTGALVALARELKKEAVLAAWTVGSADVIYGGLGDDFLHGGAGDDAISGAEALPAFYNEAPQVDPDPLRYNAATTKFAAYDADDPWSKIPGFLLNFDAYRVDEASGDPLVVGGVPVKSEDGRDRIFGDNGNDWIVGGTDCDWMFGGLGDDLINLDDFLETNGGLNNRPEDDERFRDGDFAFGGAGRDVMIANTAQDRMFDWHGEFNTYVVPFAPFGNPTVNREFQPAARNLIRALAYAAGTDGTLTPFEPFDEIALVEPQDGQLYHDQTGGPRDPQPGNIGGVQRDDVGGPNLDCRCDFSPRIQVAKLLWTTDGTVEGVSATSGVGPVIRPGTGVYWTYDVTNTSVGSATTPVVSLQITRIVDDLGTAADPSDDFAPEYVSGDTDGDGLLDMGETWHYTSQPVVDYVAQPGPYTNTVTVEASAGNGATAAGTATNRHQGSVTGLRIKKAVNAVDELQPTFAEEADGSTGPVLPVGATVKWTYRVFNETSTSMASVLVLDDNGTPEFGGDDFAPTFVSGDSNADGLLDPGEVWLYRALGTAVQDLYSNAASVTAMSGTDTLTAFDRAHYLGTTGVRIVKAVNATDPLAPTPAEDANSAPGAAVLVGAPLVFTYLVVGESVVPLGTVVVRDDNATSSTGDDFNPIFVSGDTDGDHLLDFGEVWLFTSVGAAAISARSGTSANTATVTAQAGGMSFTATDVAYVTGTPGGLRIVKAVNALDPIHPTAFEDANTAPGPSLVVGTTVTWTYAVFATGLVPVTNLVVTDAGATVTPVTTAGINVGDVDADGRLDPGEAWLFRATGTVVAGQYMNIGTVTGTEDSSGAVLGASDAATYFGTPARIVVGKAVNAVNPASPTAAEDANDPRTPLLVQSGNPVVFTYLVTNLGSVALTNVAVIDDNGTPDDVADDFQAALVSGDRNGNGRLDRTETWLFQSPARVAAPGLHTNVGRATGVAGGITFVDDDPASHFGWLATLRVQKATNAADPANPSPVEDGNVAPGQVLGVDSAAVWTYRVSNDGNVPLTVSLRDDFGTPSNTADDFTPRLLSGDANANRRLDPGEVWSYTSAGVVSYLVRPGQYMNLATATSTAPDGSLVTASDRSFHVGATTTLTLVKAVNAADPFAPTAYEDANVVPGVVLPAGTPVTWTYLVTNRGNVPLDLVGVTDDGGVPGSIAFLPDPILSAGGTNIGDLNANALLDPREAWLFRSVGTVAAGPYRNTAIATGTFKGVTPELTVTVTDVANISGTPPGIAITKAVNGQAADTPGQAVYVAVGAPVTWTYAVSATTTVPIASVVVTDDAGTPAQPADDFSPAFVGGDTNANSLLDPGETWTYQATGTLPAGLFGNVGRVAGVAGGVTVLEDDLAYAFGVTPRVSIQKATDALNPLAPTELEAADGPLIPELFVTGNVVFTYVVTNPGAIRLQVDKTTGVRDDNGTPGSPSDDFSAVYVSGDGNADGWLDPGERWLFRSPTVTVQAGSHTNTATVTAFEPRTVQTATSSNTASYFGRTGAEGHTPGFWKTNVDTKGAIAWPRTSAGTLVLEPGQPVSSLFAGLPAPLADLTLVDALGLGGGGIDALLRHAVSAVLNAVHPWVSYPLSVQEIVTRVNAAIASSEAGAIDSLKNVLQGYNELGSDLDANGRVPPPTLSVLSTSVAEGNSGTSTVFVTIALSGPALTTVRVNWATANVTATAGSDYISASGTVTFAPGQAVVRVPITVFGDVVIEPNETFRILLSGSVGASMTTSTATVTIANDDGA
jgi:Ca2+-binding RTX toxin-like protein